MAQLLVVSLRAKQIHENLRCVNSFRQILLEPPASDAKAELDNRKKSVASLALR